MSLCLTPAPEEGDPYIDEDGRTTSFNSVWKRFMDRVLKETKVTQRFAERDLRAKAATDKEEAQRLERARKLLGHVDARITKKMGTYGSQKSCAE